jgi:hypothetical protein
LSERDSFIREVSEEVRRERFATLLRRYGWIGALVILVIVGGAGFNEWRKAREQAAAEQAGETLRAAYVVEPPAARADALGAAADEVAGVRPVARIAQAGALLEAGDRAGAASVLASVSEDSSLSPTYRDLALLQRVTVLGPDLDRTERLAALETLARPEGPFRALALEQRALARLEAGEYDEARADLGAVLGEPDLPEGLSSRAQQLLIAAGGSLPGANGIGLERAPVPGEEPPDALLPGNTVPGDTMPDALLPDAQQGEAPAGADGARPGDAAPPAGADG